MQTKLESIFDFRNFLAMVECQFDSNIKHICRDDALEFFFQMSSTHFSIIKVLSCLGTPKQNGIIEQKHRDFLNIACCLHFQVNLQLEFWNIAFSLFVILLIALLLKFYMETSYKILFNKPPAYHHLHVFCCLCYVYNIMEINLKFYFREKTHDFIGYTYAEKT